MSEKRLLAGKDLRLGAETLQEHRARNGPVKAKSDLIESLIDTGLRGRGGGGFLVGEKWRAVAERSKGNAVVVVNGAEGEPLSLKDRLLMSTRPHLVLDGAEVAAESVKAREIVVYIGAEHKEARSAMQAALRERTESRLRKAKLVSAPMRYVAGESSAVVHLLNNGSALPTHKGAAHLAGVGGASTLIQNVESLAQAALIARHGAAWYGEKGVRGAKGTVLLSIAGGVAHPGVLEVEQGTSIGEALALAGGSKGRVKAVLLGGYFGSWIKSEQALGLPLDAQLLREQGWSLGCGVLGFLLEGECGVCESAKVMRYLANESSAQCGPCFFGLRALAETCEKVANRGTSKEDLERLERWGKEVRGRGACKHPDGASIFLLSALRTFKQEYAEHPAHWRQS